MGIGVVVGAVVAAKLLAGGSGSPASPGGAVQRPPPPKFTKPKDGFFWTVGFHPGTSETVFGKGHEANPPGGRVARAKELVGPIPHRAITWGGVPVETWEQAEALRAVHLEKIRKPIAAMSTSSGFGDLGALGLGQKTGSWVMPGYDDLPAFVEYVHRGGEKHTNAAVKYVKENGANLSFWGSGGIGVVVDALAKLGDLAGLVVGVPGLGSGAKGNIDQMVSTVKSGDFEGVGDLAKLAGGM